MVHGAWLLEVDLRGIGCHNTGTGHFRSSLSRLPINEFSSSSPREDMYFIPLPFPNLYLPSPGSEHQGIGVYSILTAC